MEKQEIKDLLRLLEKALDDEIVEKIVIYEYYCDPIEIVKDFVEEEKAARVAAEEEDCDE